MNNKQLADWVELIIAIFFLGMSVGFFIKFIISIVEWIAE
ncbi:hypothetical protein X792_04890 [Dehalococcoides mccartyi CG1]|jgi:hypothetical protein|nr:hypothetical protein X792_04890 [Dehalococcoides mccartyi CG1]